MRSTISSVRFDPSGQANNYQEIHPLHPLQEKGSYDISLLVYEIVTKDFGYLGTEKYTLTLKNNEMILEIWERPYGTMKRHFGKIEMNNEQWVLISATSSTLPNQQAVSQRLSNTLHRINQAYSQQPPSPLSAALIGGVNTQEQERLKRAEEERLRAAYAALEKANRALIEQIRRLEELIN